MGEVTKEQKYGYTELGEQMFPGEAVDEITWNDLDMDDLYLRINTCHSFAGEQVLFARMHRLAGTEELQILEEKIGYTGENKEEAKRIGKILYRIGKEEGSYFLPVFLNNLDVFSIEHVWFYRLMRALLALSLVPALVFQEKGLLYIPVAVFGVNLLIYLAQKYRYELNLNTLEGALRLIKAAVRLTDSGKFAYEERFQDLKEHADCFRPLARMIGRVQNRRMVSASGTLEGLLYDYFFGALLLDFIRYDKIIKQLKQHRETFLCLYRRIGELDMALAAAKYRESLPRYCTPRFAEQKGVMMEELCHPLIENAVANSLNLTDSCMVTGSNASGKSTFIKAVALNAILAQTLHTCTAGRFEMCCAKVVTSMAVRDDLAAGESYYVREVKYLARIVKGLSDKVWTLCVIDEILRGTNTRERVAASAAVLRYLEKRNCLAVVATHDQELLDMLETGYMNYHFTEHMEDGKITFDYKIHPGPANSQNAIRLLECMGFPEEITREARLRA